MKKGVSFGQFLASRWMHKAWFQEGDETPTKLFLVPEKKLLRVDTLAFPRYTLAVGA
jgi:hypothetical protein